MFYSLKLFLNFITLSFFLVTKDTNKAQSPEWDDTNFLLTLKSITIIIHYTYLHLHYAYSPWSDATTEQIFGAMRRNCPPGIKTVINFYTDAFCI